MSLAPSSIPESAPLPADRRSPPKPRPPSPAAATVTNSDLILRSAPFWQRTCAVRSRVSKDGRESMRYVHPSRRLLRRLLKMRSAFLHRL